METNSTKEGWRVSDGSHALYIESIKEFLSSEDCFSNFRQPSTGYNAILEHVCPRGGNIYSAHLKSNHSQILEKYLEDFKKNDSIGNPVLQDYEGFGEINTTTLRYIKYAVDILEGFGPLNNYDLIEIGGGYGGLARILNCVYNFKSIKLVDLPEPLELQSKYLSKFSIPCETYEPQDDIHVEKKTLVVSNFAWCECDKDIRNKYIKDIISKCNRVYIVTYHVDTNELTILDGEKNLDKDIYSQSTTASIFTLKKDES
tara:strand:+ start:912 stop:1685 length:774 start_codon:yes stop_codon:yes gene_type:complete